jgi:N-acetylneuraminate lyase
MSHFRGIWPALVTPLTLRGEVDTQAAQRLIEAVIATGIGGLYVCGGTGEGVLLSGEARRRMAQCAVDAVAGRVPVMVHVGAITTQEAVELTEHANRIGADAVSAIPPFYYSYAFEAILAHYRAIAQASVAPVYIYYIPGSTGIAVSPEQLLEICAIEGIAGLKYTSQDLYFLSRLLAMRDPDAVNVLSGPDELFLPCLALGVEGAIGTTYNFMPRTYLDIYHGHLAGEAELARSLQMAASDVIAVMLRYGVIPATKALLKMLGHDVGYGVPPMPPIEGPGAEALEADLRAGGLFELVVRAAQHPAHDDLMRGRLA